MKPVVISPDQYLIDEEGTQTGVKKAWDLARQDFRRAIRQRWVRKVVLMVGAPASGKSTWLVRNKEWRAVYFDACLDLPWKRESFIEQAADYDLPVEIVWLDTPLRVCLRRNRERTQDRQVPETVIRAMAAKIAECPPDGEAENCRLFRVVTN